MRLMERGEGTSVSVFPPFRLNSLLKNTIVAFFNLARVAAKLLPARKITTYVAILSITSCDVTAC